MQVTVDNDDGVAQSAVYTTHAAETEGGAAESAVQVTVDTDGGAAESAARMAVDTDDDVA